MTVNLSSKFKDKLIKRFKKFFIDTFSTLFKHALILHEFIYIAFNFELIRYPVDKGILHKYKIIVEKC